MRLILASTYIATSNALSFHHLKAIALFINNH